MKHNKIVKKILLFLFLIAISVNAQKSMKLITPLSLKIGDTIAIVAPAGILKNRKAVIDLAKKQAEKWGLKVVYGKNMFNQNDHFAGTDEERCQDFQDALDNPNIKAIWAARGGYGSVRILDMLDFTAFKKHPKWIIGYSDITAFHNHIHNLGVETAHAIMGTSFQDKAEVIAESVESLRKVLFGENLNYKITSSKYNKIGTVSGELIGGNIAVLTSMLGSSSQISTDGKILFIEEIGEYKYSIDRMLQSLKRAGYFTKVKGIIVGDMTKVKKNSTPWGSSIEQLILDVVPNNIPILFDFPAGHETKNLSLIMGRKVELAIGSEQSSVVFK